MELDDWQARELEEDVLESWLAMRDEIDRGGRAYEYFEGLARFARQTRYAIAMTDDERQALDDIIWISAAAQRESLLGTTGKTRLDDTRAAFRRLHDREPISLTRRLRKEARKFFDGEAAAADARARGLRRGLHGQGLSVTPTMVTMRTHHLRRAKRLPQKSRPRSYGDQRAGT